MISAASFLAGFLSCAVFVLGVAWVFGDVHIQITRDDNGKITTKSWGGK